LLHEDGKSPSELSRKEEIFKSHSGLYSMAGGKLTGFRKMAEKMVDRVVADLQSREPGRSFREIATGVTTISGGMLGAEGFEPFQNEMVKQGARYGLEREVVETLVQRYGSNVRQIFGYLDQDLAQKVRVGGPLPVIRAEVTYAVEQEMTVTLTDFLLRRTGDLLFAAEQALAGAPRLLEEFAMQLGWDAAERERQMRLWDDAVQQARGFLAE
jgi:glycerol-3-phosphate dehydrogenase